MSSLAAPKCKLKLSDNPNGNIWASHKDSFARKMMAKMGWSEGKGLGKEEQGIQEIIKVHKKSSKTGVGCSTARLEETYPHMDFFANTPPELCRTFDSSEVPIPADIDGAGVEEEVSSTTGSSSQTAAPTSSVMSLEEHGRNSRARLHYSKFTRAKDVSRYSDKDLACIFGWVQQPGSDSPERSSGGSEPVVEEEKEEESSFGVFTRRTGQTMAEYFKEKMSKKRQQVSNDDAEIKTELERSSQSLADEDNDDPQERADSGAEKRQRKRKRKHRECDSYEGSRDVNASLNCEHVCSDKEQLKLGTLDEAEESAMNAIDRGHPSSLGLPNDNDDQEERRKRKLNRKLEKNRRSNSIEIVNQSLDDCGGDTKKKKKKKRDKSSKKRTCDSIEAVDVVGENSHLSCHGEEEQRKDLIGAEGEPELTAVETYSNESVVVQSAAESPKDNEIVVQGHMAAVFKNSNIFNIKGYTYY